MSLDRLRNKVDRIDRKLLGLLNERTRLAMEIGRIKERMNLEPYVPAREKAVLARMQNLNSGPLSDESVRAIYREIMSAALALEKQVKVACPGPENSLSFTAARARFGASVKYVACKSLAAVFAMVKSGKATYGIIPIDRTGRWKPGVELLDCFKKTALRICAETLVPVRGRKARFLVLAKSCGKATGNDRTSVFFALSKDATGRNKRQALPRNRGMSLLKIANGPRNGAKDSPVFFADFNGHPDNPAFSCMLKGLERGCSFMLALGSYPKAY